MWDINGLVTNLLTALTMHFKEVFGQTASSISVHDQLYRLCQVRSTVNDYALQFHTLAVVSGWNETALITAFRRLNSNICQQMAIYDDVIGLESFIQFSIRISRLTVCILDQTTLHPPSTSPSVAPPHLSPCKETQPTCLMQSVNRESTNVCAYCVVQRDIFFLPVQSDHHA